MAQRPITKRKFNVVLDTYNTASFTGFQFDATFQVDLTRIVQNPDDLAKPYKITFSYYMQNGSFANTLLVATALYSLNISMRRKNYIQNYDKPETYAGNIQAELITQGTGFGVTRMIARPQDNPPFYVDNLIDFTEVRLTTYVNSTGIIVNPTNGTSYNNLTKYLVYLHFEEL